MGDFYLPLLRASVSATHFEKTHDFMLILGSK